MWISMKLLERRICFNKSEIVKFSDDRVDRMDRSRMPVVSQRMVWLHQRTALQMCFALTHEILHWNCSGKAPERRSRDCLDSYHHPLHCIASPPIAPLLLQGMSSPLTAGYFDNFQLTYNCTSDNWCLKKNKTQSVGWIFAFSQLIRFRWNATSNEQVDVHLKIWSVLTDAISATIFSVGQSTILK